MASTRSGLLDGSDNDIARQIATLGKQISTLQKQLPARGAAIAEDGWDHAADLYADMRERFSELLPQIRRQARSVEKSARAHPGATAAVVGLVVVGLAVALMSRR